MSPPRLTFGVEFEFNLATLAEDIEDPEPEDKRRVRGIRDPYMRTEINNVRLDEFYDTRVKKSVAKVLKDIGLPTRVINDPDDEEGNDWYQMFYPWLGGRWVVTSDSSVFGIESAYDWWSIEINSPPLIFCPEALDAVALVCKTVTSNFRCLVNESCGLHVHVGNGNDNFSAETMKKLMAFLWCFEPVIDQIHPPHRRNGSYCRSIRVSSEYGNMLQEPGGTVTGILRRILLEKRKNVLLERMEDMYEHRGAYYTGNMRPTPGSQTAPVTKVTLEFRQHEGTLDGQKTVYWVRLVVGLFEFIDECDTFALCDFLFHHAGLEDAGGKVYDIHHLLRDIGLEEVAEFYEHHLVTPRS